MIDFLMQLPVFLWQLVFSLGGSIIPILILLFMVRWITKSAKKTKRAIF